MALTERQLHFWNENGYLVFENVFTPTEVEKMRRGVEALVAQAEGLTESTDRFKLKAFETGGMMVQQIAEPHEMSGEWLDLAKDPRILDIVESLLGPNIQLYYSMLMMKPPRQGFTAPWHQDFAFFVHDRADLLACQVYIDDSTLENGCVEVVPGSHKLGLLNHFKDGRFTGIVQGDTTEFDQQRVPLPVKAGGIAFWHCLTLHSSKPNLSERPRRAIVYEYKNPQARLLSGVFNPRLEVRPVGIMMLGRDPSGDLLATI
ncbi:MAG: phytanoyl-CoA dioxygenase family protein [Anaerolineae bacterium]|nr:phytanoyl-CoA dioxygenase family protein [Anaerolineae bacterium]MDW8100557.1 phytanoyl-CoA dioxygenase family protein [Anaerolineae bacterium]